MKLRTIIFLLMIVPVISAQAQKKKKRKEEAKTAVTMSNLEDTVSYCLGMNIGFNVTKQGFENINIDLLVKGVEAGLGKGDSALFDVKEAEGIINSYFQNAHKRKMEENVSISQAWLEENKTKEGVITLESGLQYEVLKEGTGVVPAETDKVKVHYHGTLTDGAVFDSSVDRGEPAEFPVTGVIKGWVEALQLMKVGSKWKLFVPPALGYGDRGAGGMIGPNVVLIFEVELLDIVQ